MRLGVGNSPIGKKTNCKSPGVCRLRSMTARSRAPCARFCGFATQSCSQQNRHAPQARGMPGDGLVTGQIEQCITHQFSFMGIYSNNLVFICKEGTINVILTSNSGYENTVEFLTTRLTRIEVQHPYLGTAKFPDTDNP